MGLRGTSVSKLVAMIFICMVTVAPSGSATAISCDDVREEPQHCIGYVIFGGEKPATGGPCWAGVRSLVGKSKESPTTSRSVCECLKDDLNQFYSNEVIQRAAGLSQSCGVKFPFAITWEMNCNQLHKLKF